LRRIKTLRERRSQRELENQDKSEEPVQRIHNDDRKP
jgi:hypothetical protein